jgi:TetR/AcrR family transcriptional regulator
MQAREKPMGRQDSRSKLVEVATRLFSERGFHGVSIRELSQAAEISISMISYYFGGKEGLYSSVLQEQFASFDDIDKIKKEGAEPLQVLEAYLRWTIGRHRSSPHLLRFYTSELTNPTPCFSTIVSPAIGKVIGILIEVVKEGIENKQFREGLNPADTVLAIAGMVNYYFLSTLATENFVSHSAERDEELIRQYMELLFKGIRKDPDHPDLQP